MADSNAREAGAQAACPAQFTIDFADLRAGTILGEQYSDLGVHISAVANENHPDALIVFDTNAPPTHDPDLAVDIGNIAILAENVRDKNGDGLVDDPDENNFGGKVTFSFDQDVRIGSFIFVDHDHQPADFAAAYDASGNLITKVLIPIAGDGSVQTVAVNADGVRRFELVYRDSAGFTGIEVECEQQGQQPTATPTAGAGGATATPTSPAGGPTPTPTPVTGGATATPTPVVGGAAASPTPAAAGAVSTAAPAAQAAAAVAAEAQARPEVAVLGAQQLPSGGGMPPEEKAAFSLAVALASLTLVIGGAFLAMRRIRR